MNSSSQLCLLGSATPNIFVTNTTVQNNGYVGLYYLPTSGASARLVFDRVTANNNQYGISITNSDGASSVYGFSVVVMNSTAVLNSQRGFEFIGDGDGHTVSAYMHLLTASPSSIHTLQVDKVLATTRIHFTP